MFSAYAIEHRSRYAKVHGANSKLEGTPSLMQVLIDFDQWLSGFGKRFVHVDTSGADYVGCIIEQDGVEDVIALARQAGIDARVDPF